MKSAKVNIGDNVLASQYNDLRSDAYGGSFLLPHQQTSPDLTLKVEAGVCYVGATRVIYAGGNSPSFAAPSSNPRIDLLTIDNTGTLARVAGTESASPVAPAYPSDKLVICEVYNRVSQTQIFDTDQGAGKGYIYNDVRPFLGGAYIASTNQIATGALTGDKFAGLGSIPSGAGVIPNANLPSFAPARFGGTGADGALSISSGTTTIDCGGARVLVKNYTSISITGTGKLAFTNKHGSGTVVILKSQGNVDITSSTNPCIELTGIGGSSGSFGNSLGDYAPASAEWRYNYPGGASTYGAVTGYWAGGRGVRTVAFPYGKGAGVWCGAGGMGSAEGVSGGTGGGGLYIECAGALNFTGTIWSKGSVGSNGSSSGVPGHSSWAGGGGASLGDGGDGGMTYNTTWQSSGGGGGAGGCVVILYNSLTTNSGTITVTGASGGSGATTGGQGADGYSFVGQNTEFS